MDKALHIRILDVLQQNNAVSGMVDIKPAFLDELDSLEKRKHFKSQVDYLINQGFIETNGRFDYLTWELLNGLYPIENKRIEARLIGNWDIYFSKKRGGGIIKPEPAAITPPPPVKKISLYDAPASVLPYPGVSLKDGAPKPPPPATTNTSDDLFKTRPAVPAASAPAQSMDEDDFEPFKTKNPAPKVQAPVAPPKPPAKPEVPGIVEFSPNKAATYSPPKEAGTMASLKDEFVPHKPNYIPPKTEPAKPAQILTYTPPKPGETPAEEPAQPEVSTFTARIAGKPSHLKKEDEEEEPVFTSRLPKQFKNAPPVPPPAPKPEPKPEPQAAYPSPATPPAPKQVVNLRTPPPAPMADVPPAPINYPPAPTPYMPPAPYTPPPLQHGHYEAGSNYSSVQFDTENNPFAALGMIDLSLDTKDQPKKNTFLTVLKWTAFAIVLLIIIAGIVVYKKKYT